MSVNYNAQREKLSSFIYDEQRTKRALNQFADKVGPDQYAHPCSLILAFSVRQHILQYPLIL